MWKAAATVVSLFVVAGGLVLRLPWIALDWIGRLLTMLDSPQLFAHLVDWIPAHPIIAVDFGPWALIAAGFGSLAIVHGPFLRRLAKRLRPTERGSDEQKKVVQTPTQLPPPLQLTHFPALQTVQPPGPNQTSDPMDPSEVGRTFSNQPISYFINILNTQNLLQAKALIDPHIGTLITLKAIVMANNIHEVPSLLFSAGFFVEGGGAVVCQYAIRFRNYLTRLQDQEKIDVTGTIIGASGSSLLLNACHPPV